MDRDHYQQIKLYNIGMKVQSVMVRSLKDQPPVSAKCHNRLVFHESDEESSNGSIQGFKPPCLTSTSSLTERLLPKQSNSLFKTQSSIVESQLPSCEIGRPSVKRNNFMGDSLQQKKVNVTKNSVPDMLIFVESSEDEQGTVQQGTHEQVDERAPKQVFLLQGQQKQVKKSKEEQICGKDFSKVLEPTILQQKSEKQPISLLQISQQSRLRSAYFQQAITSGHSDSIRSIMFAPLRQGSVHIFQVHVYSSLTQRTFQLWMDSLPTMKLLMKAVKSFSLHRTTYEMAVHIEQSRQFRMGCILTSNFDRSQYCLQGGDKSDSLLATITCGATLQKSKNLVLYYPALDPLSGTTGLILPTQDLSSLKRVYQEQKERLVDYVVTGRISEEERGKLMQDHSWRASEKSMQLWDSEEQLRVLIGKKGSKRYCLISGPGLSPAQLFALAIINIETS